MNETTVQSQVATGLLSIEELQRMDAWWRAANYLSVGQIYLLDNPLLKEPLTLAHVKPRLLGHWGTTPGLNFIHAHLNRVINKNDLSVLYVAGPGHGGPGLVANTWLEGSYSEFYPNVGRRLAFEQVSEPGLRRRGAADPVSERLQDRQPHGARAHPAQRPGHAGDTRLEVACRRRGATKSQ